ncbi:hypothetical protein ACJ73_08094 [Blastomyces percursus]|uniref:Uncharacterized protein n=1 Tax=Blastomyces percursus TaxID=1658174 RepID=A0A1J9PWA5_9EURO|nr:hypothetical protein ACJ73_08094 [Blastomyces percursus]
MAKEATGVDLGINDTTSIRVNIGKQKLRRARKGLTRQRYRTVKKIIDRGVSGLWRRSSNSGHE